MEKEKKIKESRALQAASGGEAIKDKKEGETKRVC